MNGNCCEQSSLGNGHVSMQMFNLKQNGYKCPDSGKLANEHEDTIEGNNFFDKERTCQNNCKGKSDCKFVSFRSSNSKCTYFSACDEDDQVRDTGYKIFVDRTDSS